jgi:glutathione S-transferase
MSPPRLWSWHLSPFAGKARIAFAEKGVPVELLEVDPRARPPRLRALNPSNRVPVLEVGDVAIRESTAICEWLEETHPEPPLWPADAAARAAARGLLRWVDDELTLNFFLSMRKEAFGLDRTDHPDLVTILRERLVRR